MSEKRKGSQLYANRQGDLTVELEPNNNQTKLTVVWKEETAMQEGASVLSVMLDSALLNTLVNDALESSGEDKITITGTDVTIEAGAVTRHRAATVTMNAVPPGSGNVLPDAQQLAVTFHPLQSDFHDAIDSEQTSIPTTDFSKANYVYGLEYMEEWRATWQRAIALAWSDPGSQPTSLKSQLLANPFHFFKQYCNYALPPTVDVVVVDASDVKPEGCCAFVPDQSDPNGPNWKWKLPRSVLIMFLPPPPPAGTSTAVALAAYEAVGKSYPFTMTS
jgi:ribosomally synthesized peptide (two-chain TOMM family)